MQDATLTAAQARTAVKLQQDAASANDYAKGAWATNTKRNYRTALIQFACYVGTLPPDYVPLNTRSRRTLTAAEAAARERRERDAVRAALPVSGAVLKSYIAHLANAGAKPATIELKLAALAHAHRLAGLEMDRSEAVLTLRGIKRDKGTAQRKAGALKQDALLAIVEALPDTLLGKRNKALLLLGWAGALRVSELVGLDVGDAGKGSSGFVRFEERGLLVTLTRSKTDQEQRGQVVAVPYGATANCPVRAVSDWLNATGIDGGPLFLRAYKGSKLSNARLSAQGARKALGSAAVAAGMAKEVVDVGGGVRRYEMLNGEPLSPHSLRAGFITSATGADVGLAAIKRQSRHKSLSCLLGYVREAQAFRGNALRKMGL